MHVAMRILAVPFETSSAVDARGFARALAGVRCAARGRLRQLAVLAKIEGAATLQDRSRERASEAFGAVLGRAGLRRQSLEILSAGCEGVITPCGTLVATCEAPASRARGLAMGHARSPAIPMAQRASLRHVDAAEQAVAAAMREAGLSAKQVALVLIKSPVLLRGKGRHVGSTGASRGAAALGAALALGEVRREALRGDFLENPRLYGTRAMAFSGTETDCCEAVVFGHRPGGDASLRLERAMLADLLDTRPLERLAGSRGKLVAVFFKAGIPANGRLRGARTTVLTSELAPDKQLRAAAGGIVAAAFGTTRAFVSGGAEHQAPPGGCLVATIRKVRPARKRNRPADFRLRGDFSY